MAVEALELRRNPQSDEYQSRQRQKPHSAYQGGWRHTEVARWFARAIIFKELLNAVDYLSPPINTEPVSELSEGPREIDRGRYRGEMSIKELKEAKETVSTPLP